MPLAHLTKLSACAACLFASCAVGPRYSGPPATDALANYKNEGGKWKTAEPQENAVRSAWWKIFHDPTLDRLENQVIEANQDLKISLARLNESRAQVRVAAADFLPGVSAQPSFVRQRTSNQEPFQKGQLLGPSPFAVPGAAPSTEPLVLNNQPLSRNSNVLRLPANLNWELDLFGRVRRATEAARANQQASEADFENLQLSVTASAASSYFNLRALDSELAVVSSTIKTRQEAVEIAGERLQAGLTDELDVARARSELATNQATVFALQRSRDEVENSLATLLGQSASGFHLPAQPLSGNVPAIPVGLPSELLERRPDIAAAERELAAANASIGVATAAFFPQIRITGAAGFESAQLSDLFRWESRLWQLGPGISLPIFEGGRNVANLASARARYEEQTGVYRKQVLVAFQEVETSLGDLRNLAGQAEAQERGLAAGRRALELSRQQYDKGAINYLDVLDAQRTVLQEERTASTLRGQRFQATVQLIKALGGGWK